MGQQAATPAEVTQKYTPGVDPVKLGNREGQHATFIGYRAEVSASAQPRKSDSEGNRFIKDDAL